MKNLLLLLFISVSATITEQGLTYDKWDVAETTDDFGDKTGEVINMYFSQGKFSNSATTGADMIFKIVDYGKDEKGAGTASIDFYEYNKTPARLGLDTTLGSLKCKLPDGTVKTFQLYAMKQGGLGLWGKYYDSFFELINNGKGDKVKFVVNESDFSEYGGSKYNGHFHTKTADILR